MWFLNFLDFVQPYPVFQPHLSHAQQNTWITKLKKPKQGASRGSSVKSRPTMKKSRRYGSRSSYGKSSKNLKDIILFNLAKKPVLLVTIVLLISILQYRENFSSLTKLLGRQRSMPDFTPPTSSDECKQMLLHGYWQEFFYGVLKKWLWKVEFFLKNWEIIFSDPI